MTPWPKTQYRVIAADPPWSYREAWGNGAAAHHYATMTVAEICALPVADLALPDCALFLWATAPLLDVAVDVVKAWGFGYKTVAFTWAKVNRDGTPHLGLGFYTRGNAEFVLLGTRGSMSRHRLAEDVSSLVIASRQEHSRKPAEVYRRIEQLYPGPRVELFARGRRRGWDVWGAEADAPVQWEFE